MKEHNNRLKAKKLAEYITGQELRQYVARKIKSYIPNLKTVFDGAIGSGQLEQYLEAEKIYGVEIQEESYLTTLENYPNADIECKSFFNYKRADFVCDTVIMNPPFSIKFNALTEEEQKNIQEEFAWKKSGVVDDIFVLKSLKYAKRYAFYILFPGVCYRKTEYEFRKTISNNLKELNIIENAFEDTNISVIFIVIDKEKQDNSVYKEVYDCKFKKILKSETTELEEDFRWQRPIVEKEVEVIDIDEVNQGVQKYLIDFVDSRLGLDVFVKKTFGSKVDILATIREIEAICRKYRNMLKGNNEEWKKHSEKIERQLIFQDFNSLF